jgi:hypothetical protein
MPDVPPHISATTKYKIQVTFKKLGNKRSDPENFIPNPMYTWHMGIGWYTSDLHVKLNVLLIVHFNISV